MPPTNLIDCYSFFFHFKILPLPFTHSPQSLVLLLLSTTVQFISSKHIYLPIRILQETLFRLKTCKPFLVLCIAAGIRAIGGYALGAWLATYYARVLMLPSRQFGFILAIIVFLGGGMSSLVAGYLADK